MIAGNVAKSSHQEGFPLNIAPLVQEKQRKIIRYRQSTIQR